MNKPFHILLVDDEPNVLKALERCLVEDDDFDLTTATSPAEAHEVLNASHVDVVVSDHDMPTTNGIEFLRSVREQHPETVRLMLSGRADLKMAMEAVNDETIYRFLSKPWEDVEIRLILRLALRHRDDQLRVRELSRLVASQAALFAELLDRYPECRPLVEQHLQKTEVDRVSVVG